MSLQLKRVKSYQQLLQKDNLNMTEGINCSQSKVKTDVKREGDIVYLSHGQ